MFCGPLFTSHFASRPRLPDSAIHLSGPVGAQQNFHLYLKMPKQVIGTRLEVYRGKRTRTSGGLTKKDLALSKSGKVVSKRKQQIAKTKRNNLTGHLRPLSRELRSRGKVAVSTHKN